MGHFDRKSKRKKGRHSRAIKSKERPRRLCTESEKVSPHSFMGNKQAGLGYGGH